MVKKSFYLLATPVSEGGIKKKKQGKYISKIYKEKKKKGEKEIFVSILTYLHHLRSTFFCLF